MVIVLLNMFLVLTSIPANQNGFSETVARRVENVLNPIYNSNTFSYHPIEKTEFTRLYMLDVDSTFAGYLVLTSSIGRFERFQYMILYSKEVEVKKVRILEYNSSQGTGVTSKRWLKQFEGNKGEALKYGKDVQAISGATYSATSITEDIPIVTQWVKEILFFR